MCIDIYVYIYVYMYCNCCFSLKSFLHFDTDKSAVHDVLSRGDVFGRDCAPSTSTKQSGQWISMGKDGGVKLNYRRRDDWDIIQMGSGNISIIQRWWVKLVNTGRGTWERPGWMFLIFFF